MSNFRMLVDCGYCGRTVTAAVQSEEHPIDCPYNPHFTGAKDEQGRLETSRDQR